MENSKSTRNNNSLIDRNRSIQSASKKIVSQEYYPACWQDDDRMYNLFAPFRDKSVNPVNYETKMKFWKNLIQEYCLSKGSPSMSLNELQLAFQRKGKKPHCLNKVLDELLGEGLIQKKSQFMEAPITGWVEWAVHKLVKTPLRWSFERVKERVVNSITTNKGNCDQDTEYIIIGVTKVIAEKLLLTFNASNECHTIVSKDDLIKQVTENDVFKLDGIDMALHFLNCNQKLSMQKIQIDKQEVTLCKFSVTWDCHVEPITPLDTLIYTLNKMEKSLAKSVEAIEVDINNTDSLVRQYLQTSKKQLAKSFLRKKHVLEKNLVKTSNALTTIQTLILKIDETTQNEKIVEALKMGTKTLKHALSEKNITVDAVEDALDDVKEVLETNAEIQCVLSGAQFNDIINDGTDDETLESELMNLLADDENVANTNQNAQSKQTEQNNTLNSPTTITNGIDVMLEERLNKLKLDDSLKINTVDSNRKFCTNEQNIGL